MADIDQPGTVAPVVAALKREGREPQARDKPVAHGKGEGAEGEGTSNWRHNVKDVAFIMGIPAQELTAKVQEALTIIMGEFDRLRDELDRTKEKVAYLEKLADEHAFLPAVNRRALLRELSRVIARSEKSGLKSSFVSLALDGVEEIRRIHGRDAADAALAHGLRLVAGAVRASDVVGSLSDTEIGIVLALSDEGAAEDKARHFAELVGGTALSWEGHELRLRASFGVSTFTAGDTATVKTAADHDRRRRLAAPTASGSAPPSAPA